MYFTKLMIKTVSYPLGLSQGTVSKKLIRLTSYWFMYISILDVVDVVKNMLKLLLGTNSFLLY